MCSRRSDDCPGLGRFGLRAAWYRLPPSDSSLGPVPPLASVQPSQEHRRHPPESPEETGYERRSEKTEQDKRFEPSRTRCTFLSLHHTETGRHGRHSCQPRNSRNPECNDVHLSPERRWHQLRSLPVENREAQVTVPYASHVSAYRAGVPDAASPCVSAIRDRYSSVRSSSW